MYINPFICGIAFTLLTELFFLIAYALTHRKE